MPALTVDGLTGIIGRLLPEPHASLLAGLLFGSSSALPSGLYEALITTGTIHIIALSGQNLSILAGLFSQNVTMLFGRKVACVITILLFVWFVWFVGPTPSITRAAIMGIISLVAVLWGRQYWSALSWVLAVTGMILLHPAWITDISFQLSAAATLGIILFGKGTDNVPESGSTWSSRLLGGAAKEISDSLRLTLAAQSLTTPIIFWYFHRVSLIAPVANLAIGWVIGPLTMLGWLTVAAGSVFLPLGRVLAWADWVFLEYIVRTVQIMSRIPGSSFGG